MTPSPAGLADARLSPLALAPGRDVRQDRRRDALSVAGGRSRGRDPRELRDRNPRQGRSAQVHEEGAEVPRQGRNHMNKGGVVMKYDRHALFVGMLLSGTPAYPGLTHAEF